MSIDIAAKAGVQGIDLQVRDLVEAGTDLEELLHRREDSGLRGGAWTLPMNWKNDRESFEADLKSLPAHADAAERLGLTRTGTWVRFETEQVEDLDRASESEITLRAEDATEWQLERLRLIARILDDHGSRLGLEIMGSPVAPTGRGVRLVGSYAELHRRFGKLSVEQSNVGVLIDAFHLFAAGEAIDDAIPAGVGSVVWVHLADPARLDRSSLRDEERTLPGESGVGLCEALLQTLANSGYQGPVTVEPLGRCRELERLDPLQTAYRTRESLWRIWPDEGRMSP